MAKKKTNKSKSATKKKPAKKETKDLYSVNMNLPDNTTKNRHKQAIFIDKI